MVSIVLAERHRIVAAILFNLFTQDLLISIDSGNFWKRATKVSLAEEANAVETAIASGKAPAGWKRFGFRSFEDAKAGTDRKLFLCTMGAVKKSVTPLEITCHNDMPKHFLAARCFVPHMIWKTSLD